MPEYQNISVKNSIVGSLRIVFVLLALCMLQRPILAAAPTPEQEQLLTETRHRVETLDYRVSGRLTHTDAAGKRTNNNSKVLS